MAAPRPPDRSKSKQMEEQNIVDFDPTSEKSEIIKILGVGGAGSNAVNDMCAMGIDGVNYVVCNTDRQALDNSPVYRKIQLGRMLTAGLGAGNNPERGRNSAIESLDEIRELLADNTRMVFITAGMGGGTGTGAAPVIAQAAKEMGILTIGIVSIPYRSEGKPRLRQAIKGVQEMAKHVDSLLIVNSQRLIDMYGAMGLTESLSKANNVLAVAAKGLAEMISKHRRVNVDFADVQTSLADSGCSIIGTGEGHGENRAREAVEEALKSPLLNNNDISGANYVLVSITSGGGDNELKQNEQGFILDYLYEEAGGDKNEENSIIWGFGIDEGIDDDAVKVTVIATGFTTDCLDITSSKGKQQGATRVPLSRDEPADTPQNEPADDDKPKTVDLYKDPENAKIDNILDQLYSADGARSARSTQEYDTARLEPPAVVRLDALTEEVLNNIENVPAYERRRVR